MNQPVAAVPIVRIRDGRRVDAIDQAAGEVPLEIRVGKGPFAVVMRTPGADRALVAGFLLGERIIRGSGDLALIEHCTDPAVDAGDVANIITVRLDEGAEGRRVLDAHLGGNGQADRLEQIDAVGPRAHDDHAQLPAVPVERQNLFRAQGHRSPGCGRTGR